MSENINEARRLLRKEAKKLAVELEKNRSRSRGPLKANRTCQGEPPMPLC